MSRKNANGSSITDLVGATPVVRLDGSLPSIWKFPELGAETFKAGEMVCLSGSAGNAVGLATPGTDASGFGILGFAADNASAATSSFKSVYVASPDVVFCANIGHSTVSATAQTAATDLGQRYGLTSLSGRTYVDKLKTNASTVMVRVLGLCDQDTHPSFYGRVLFHVLPTACQLGSPWQVSNGSAITATVV